MIFWQVFFWISVFLVFHSYVLFPFLLKIFSRKKTLNEISMYNRQDDLPNVSILMAVHNEYNIIEKKVRSVFNTDYPLDKIEFLIGSDNSNDGTNEVLKKLEKEYYNLKVFYYNKRSGKIKIINELVEKSKYSLIISTDAKALFLKETIFELVKYLKDNRIAACGGFLVNKRKERDGISKQENLYMDREMKIKYLETLFCLCPIGLYGALYSVKKNYFVPVPENLLVDDFYITMKIYEKNKSAVFNKNAKAIENLPNKLSEEFRRKVRIATGDFQNVKIFSKFILKPFSKVGFCFVSHKIIRWFTPFFIILSILSLLFLSEVVFYRFLLIGGIILFFVPIIDFLFGKLGFHFSLLRLITHFLAMNLALFIGFFKALKGVKVGIWEPSKRNL